MSQDVLRDPHPLLVKCVAYLRANLDWFLCSAQFRRMSDDAIDALDQMLFRFDDEDTSDTDDDDVVSQRHDDEAYYRGSNVVVKKTIAGIERRLRLIGKAKLACLSEINARLERRYRFWRRAAEIRGLEIESDLLLNKIVNNDESKEQNETQQDSDENDQKQINDDDNDGDAEKQSTTLVSEQNDDSSSKLDLQSTLSMSAASPVWIPADGTVGSSLLSSTPPSTIISSSPTVSNNLLSSSPLNSHEWTDLRTAATQQSKPKRSAMPRWRRRQHAAPVVVPAEPSVWRSVAPATSGTSPSQTQSSSSPSATSLLQIQSQQSSSNHEFAHLTPTFSAVAVARSPPVSNHHNSSPFHSPIQLSNNSPSSNQLSLSEIIANETKLSEDEKLARQLQEQFDQGLCCDFFKNIKLFHILKSFAILFFTLYRSFVFN